MATIGGNICNGSPASDTVPALLVFDAKLVIKGPAGERTAPLNGFVLSPGKVDLKPGEIVTQIILPAPVQGASSLYFKITRVVADLAKASLAGYVVRKGANITECRLAYGSVAPTPIRLPSVEAAVVGKTFSSELALNAGKLAENSIFPIDDVRSTAAYRRRVVNVMTHDAVTNLCSQDQSAIPASKFQKHIATSTVKPVPATGFELMSGGKREIELTLNGKKQTIRVKPNELLLNALREQLQMTGTKYGCGIGECSACTVLLNNQPILSCLMLAVSAEGQEVTTIEGLQKPDGTLDPLQESFIENGAFQCGYCTPGIIMTLKGLLAENAKPEEEVIRDYLKGNRCRCTGYSSIVRAVMATLE
jgi:carbon-monoxide dehydrogenase small subunit